MERSSTICGICASECLRGAIGMAAGNPGARVLAGSKKQPPVSSRDGRPQCVLLREK